MYDLTVDTDTHEFLTNGITSHNSQGSQWKYVLVHLPNRTANSFFVTNKMLYTAITRGQTAVWLIGDKDEFSRLSCNVPKGRHNGLIQMLNN